MINGDLAVWHLHRLKLARILGRSLDRDIKERQQWLDEATDDVWQDATPKPTPFG